MLCHTRRRMRRHHLALLVVGLVLATTALAACEDPTFELRFEPEVGDEYRFRSEVTTDVTRRTEAETVDPEPTRTRAILDATETVDAIDGDDITVDVLLERDSAAPRGYEVRFDRADRITAIDLIEGVPADALGLDLRTDLPAGVASPPSGPLEPGDRWEIERPIEGRGPSTVVRGRGWVESLGVRDGDDVAVIIVELTVPVRATFETPDGTVTIEGVQESRSRTAYDLADGLARADSTTITGEIEVLIDPPEGVVAPPIPGLVRYRVEAVTERVRAVD